MNIIPVEHQCPRGPVVLTDNPALPLRRAGQEVTCGSCQRSWCEACQPAPGALCVWCHGTGVDEAARMSVDLDDPEDLHAYLNA